MTTACARLRLSICSDSAREKDVHTHSPQLRTSHHITLELHPHEHLFCTILGQMNTSGLFTRYVLTGS